MRLLRVTLLAGLLLTAGAPPAQAQVGDLIDWLHKMSGPSLTTYGIKYRFPDNEPRKLLGYNPGQSVDGGVVRSIQGALASLQALSPAETAGVAQCLNAASVRAESLTGADFFHEGSVDLLRRDARTLARRVGAVGAAGPDAVQRQALLTVADYQACDLLLQLQNLPPDREWGIRFRVSAAYGHDRENDDRDQQSIHILNLQATTEGLVTFPILGHSIALGLETGIARWHWFGDFPDFASHSIPLVGNLYPFARCRGWLLHNFRIGAGWQFFAPIDRDRFLPIEFDDVDGWEAVQHVFVGIDLSASALKGNPMVGC